MSKHHYRSDISFPNLDALVLPAGIYQRLGDGRLVRVQTEGLTKTQWDAMRDDGLARAFEDYKSGRSDRAVLDLLNSAPGYFKP